MGPCFFHPQRETASEIYSKYWSLLILLKVMVKLFNIPAPVLNRGAFFFGSRALLHVVTSGKADPTPGKLQSFFQYNASHKTPWIAKPTPTKMAENHQTTCLRDALLVWIYCEDVGLQRTREREQVTHKPCKAPNEHETLKLQKKNWIPSMVHSNKSTKKHLQPGHVMYIAI